MGTSGTSTLQWQSSPLLGANEYVKCFYVADSASLANPSPSTMRIFCYKGNSAGTTWTFVGSNAFTDAGVNPRFGLHKAVNTTGYFQEYDVRYMSKSYLGSLSATYPEAAAYGVQTNYMNPLCASESTRNIPIDSNRGTYSTSQTYSADGIRYNGNEKIGDETY